jgi:hypothetical protein
VGFSAAYGGRKEDFQEKRPSRLPDSCEFRSKILKLARQKMKLTLIECCIWKPLILTENDDS